MLFKQTATALKIAKTLKNQGFCDKFECKFAWFCALIQANLYSNLAAFTPNTNKICAKFNAMHSAKTKITETIEHLINSCLLRV